MDQPQAAVFDVNNPASPLSVPASEIALPVQDYYNAIVAMKNGVAVIHCLVNFDEVCPPYLKIHDSIKGMAAYLTSQPSEEIAHDTNAPEDYVVTVIEDGCKDGKHEVHDVLLKQVSPTQAHVATAEGFQKE